MAFKKAEIVDLIETLESGCVQVRTKSVILENGIQISGAFHRHAIAPGQDYSNEDPRVQAICAVVHTPDVIAAYKSNQESAELSNS